MLIFIKFLFDTLVQINRLYLRSQPVFQLQIISVVLNFAGFRDIHITDIPTRHLTDTAMLPGTSLFSISSKFKSLVRMSGFWFHLTQVKLKIPEDH